MCEIIYFSYLITHLEHKNKSSVEIYMKEETEFSNESFINYFLTIKFVTKDSIHDKD